MPHLPPYILRVVIVLHGFRTQISKLFRGWQILVVCGLICVRSTWPTTVGPSAHEPVHDHRGRWRNGVRPGSCGPGRYFPTRGPPLCDATQSQETQPVAGATLARRHPQLLQLESWIPRFSTALRLRGTRGFSLHVKVSWLLRLISCLSISPSCEIRGSLLEDPISGFIFRIEPTGRWHPVEPNAKHHRCDPQLNFTCPTVCIFSLAYLKPWALRFSDTPELINASRHSPPPLSVTGTPVSQMASIRIRRIFLTFFGEYVDNPFINVTRRSIALPTEHCTARLPDCTISWAIALTRASTPDAHVRLGSSALPLRPTPTASTHTEPPLLDSWPAARSRHTTSPFRPPRGASTPPRPCAAGRSGINGFVRVTADTALLL